MPNEKLKEKVEKISTLTAGFCEQKLDAAYSELVGKLIGKLSRKRPSPLLKGKEEIWAAGIIHAIGQVNFLYDRSSKPNITFDELNDYFFTSKSTVGNKAAEIRKMFKMDRITGFEFMSESNKKDNIFYNSVMVNGFIVPISSLPEEYQDLIKSLDSE